jgi:hypothetical protein
MMMEQATETHERAETGTEATDENESCIVPSVHVFSLLSEHWDIGSPFMIESS